MTRWAMMLALGVLAAAPATASAQYTNFQAPAQDQYGQPPGTTPGSGAVGEEQSRGQGGSGGDRGERDGRGDGRGGNRGEADAGRGASDGATLPLRDAEGGSLPFTGLDISLVVLLGLLLTAVGFALRAAQRAAGRRVART